MNIMMDNDDLNKFNDNNDDDDDKNSLVAMEEEIENDKSRVHNKIER